MSRSVAITVIVVGLAVLAGSAFCETEFEFSGQVRYRQELSSKDFDTTAKAREFRILRTRLGIEAIIEGNTHAFVQFQDSRTIGGYDQFDSLQSGTLNDGKNVDIHQAYIRVDRLFFDNFGGKFGRFELNLGNQRVFGAVGWSNVGRSWEGCQFWFDHESLKLTGLRLKAREDDYSGGNTDFDILGLYTTLKKLNMDLFAIYEYDALEVNEESQINQLDRINAGTYYHRVYNQFDFDLNFVYQFGKKPNATMDAELDIAAFLATFEAGYNFTGEKNVRLAGGIDYASGDDDPTDDKYKAYNNLYYTGHKFRGYMDYFVGSNEAGLMDLMFRAKMNPAPKWTLAGDFHFFQTAQDYDGSYGTMTDAVLTKDVGMEFDLTVTTTAVEGLGIAAGGSVFMPKEMWAGMDDPEMAYWMYVQLTAGF